MTILLSAHQMQLVERIADRLLLLNHGREVLAGDLATIHDQAGIGRRLELKVGGQPDTDALELHPAITSARFTEDGMLSLFLRDGTSLSDLLVSLGSSLDVQDIHSERVSLHDIFLRTIGDDTRSGAER